MHILKRKKKWNITNWASIIRSKNKKQAESKSRTEVINNKLIVINKTNSRKSNKIDKSWQDWLREKKGSTQTNNTRKKFLKDLTTNSVDS